MRLFAVALLFAVCLLPAQDDLPAQMKSMIGAYAILEQNFADPVSSEQALFQGAIPGMLRKLDPHSIFFDKEQFEQLKKMENSTQKGFGSVVSLLPGRVIVLQTVPGTPSAKSGLQAGDEMVGVNGYDVSRLEVEQITQLLTQSRQQEAIIHVRRPGASRILSFTLVPEDMQSSSVDRTFFIGAGIGYIRVNSFDENTGKDLKDAIEKLGGNSLVGLVLDLRNNPGGVVTAALETASLFLDPGSKILSIRGRAVEERAEIVHPDAKPYSFKLAILMNEKSASASEVVAGAMQDHDRATILGETSYGKGLVQSVVPLAEGTAMALTTALYYTPSGRSIQKPLDISRFSLAPTTAHPNQQTEFRTDKGRIVMGGGGIQPDMVVYPPPMSRVRGVLDASGSFTNFATEYLRKNKVTVDFEVTPPVLAAFQVFTSERGIQPSVGDWATEREFISIRLKTEIFTQAFGVEKGDEVDSQRDPVIQKALDVVGS